MRSLVVSAVYSAVVAGTLYVGAALSDFGPTPPPRRPPAPAAPGARPPPGRRPAARAPHRRPDRGAAVLTGPGHVRRDEALTAAGKRSGGRAGPCRHARPTPPAPRRGHCPRMPPNGGRFG